MIGRVGRRLRCCALVCLILSSFAFVSCTGESNADLVTVEIGLHKTSLYTQESMPITAEVQWLEAADGRQVVYQWTVNDDVSELDDASAQSPRITGKAAGKAEISLSVDVLDANGKKVSSAHANKKVVDIVPRISPKSTGMQAADFVPKSVIDDFDDGVQWDSSNIEVAVIDSSTGVITPVQEGSTDITARNGVSEQLFNFRLDIAIPVQSVSLEPQSVRIQKGEKAIVKAVISPENAKDREIYWTSPNSGLVRLSFDGEQVELEGAKVGSGQIGVMTHDGYFTSVSEIEVIDTIKVSRVDLDVSSLSMRLGQKATITASAYPQDALVKDILWKVSDPSVVSIDPKGNQCVVEVIELSQSGEPVVVTAYSPDGPEGKCEVNVVNVAVDAIEIEQEDATLSKDGQKQLSARLTPQDADDLSIVWKSSNPDVLNVDENGLVTVLRIPEEDESNPIIVTAIASSGVSDEMSILVEVPMTGIRIESEKSVMGIGKSQNLSVRFIPSNTTYDRTIEWSVGDDAVLGVSEDGHVLALSAGETSVSAECTASGFADSIDLAVVQVQSLSMTNGSITILHDGSANAEAVISVLPDKEVYKDVAFFSSDEEIATVDGAGHIVAKGAGDAEISAKNIYDDSVEATLSLTVVKVRSVELNRTAVSLKGDSPFTLTADVEASPDRSIYKAVRWVSEDENLVKVEDLGDNSANITALGVTTSGPVVVKAISTKDSRVLDVCEVSTGISITGVEIVSDETSLESGDEIALLANVTTAPSTPGYGAVEWQISSQDAGIVSSSITQAGVLTAVGKGNVVVTATSAFDNSRIATKAISIVPKVSGITLSPSSATIRYGKTTSLTASVDVVPSNYDSVSWSYDPNYLSINSDGVVEAVNVTPSGVPSVVTARSSENDSFEATSSITVIPDVIMDAGSSSVSMEYGDNLQLSPSVVSSPSGYADLIWTTSSSSEVSVSDTGVIGAAEITSSPVEITATSQYDSERFVTYSVSVVPKFVQEAFVISASGNATEIVSTEELQLSVGAFVSPNRSPYNVVTWEIQSADSGVESASITQGGLLSARGKGDIVVRASNSLNSVTATKVISVVPKVTNITLAPSEYTLRYGSTTDLSVSVTTIPAGYNDLIWEYDSSKLSVSQSGHVETVNLTYPGSTVVTVKSAENESYSASSTIRVIPTVTLSEGDSTSVPLSFGDQRQLAPSVSSSPSGYTALSWQSSDPNAVSVTSTGLLNASGVTSSPVTITATSQYDSDRQIEYSVSVAPKFTASNFTITADSDEMEADEELQLSIGNFVLPNIDPYNVVEWTSSNTDVATVDQSGLVSSLADGSCTITATPKYAGSGINATSIDLTVSSGAPTDCIELRSSGSFSIRTYDSASGWEGDLWYSTDKGKSWVEWDGSEITSGLKGSTYSLRFKGKGNTRITNSTGFYNGHHWVFTASVKDIEARGNIMTLLDCDHPETATMASNCFAYMFTNCDALISAPELPATTLANNCYQYMFRSCPITVAPALPATTLADYCYSNMFAYTKITSAPELPATTLKRYCYEGMFYGSTLAEAPELPATTAAERCYNRMFNSCKNLTAAPALPATTLANNCYDSMFYYCSALAEAPALPATTLANNCYNSMFSYCSSLASAPALPATVLTSYCYKYMFKNCTSLTAAPDLPAVSLAQDCYNCMFEGCSSLVSAPALPATELVSGCYGSMFKNCTALVVPPAVFAGDVPNFVCWYMLSGCSSLKVSDTQSEEYPYAFVRFNSYVGSGTHCENMFTSTGGPFTSNPVAGVTYYTDHRPVMNDWLSGEISINSNGDKVRFTGGNLYWNGLAFDIEANQYDYRTWYKSATNNAVINGMACTTPIYGTSYSDADGNSMTGLFYWSKDVAKTYAKTYDSTGRTTSDTFALAKTSEHAAAIDKYDALTSAELSYVKGTSAARNGKYGIGTITGVNGTTGVTGVILLPDEWSLPTGCSFSTGFASGFSTNVYSVSDWFKMEQAGAVFLPATGYRNGSTVNVTGSYGYYWSASPSGNNATRMDFSTSYVNIYNDARSCGHAVRLVKRI